MLEQGRSLESGIHLMRDVSHQWRCAARGTRDVEFLVIDGGKAPGWRSTLLDLKEALAGVGCMCIHVYLLVESQDQPQVHSFLRHYLPWFSRQALLLA